MAEPFLVEFDRGAGQGGSKLVGELVLYVPHKSKKARKVADFRFVGFGDLTYSIDIETGHPVLDRYRGKFRITEAEREGLLLRLDLFKQDVPCNFCKGPAFKWEKGQPAPKQVKHRDRFVWCCPKCRQPELVR